MGIKPIVFLISYFFACFFAVKKPNVVLLKSIKKIKSLRLSSNVSQAQCQLFHTNNTIYFYDSDQTLFLVNASSNTLKLQKSLDLVTSGSQWASSYGGGMYVDKDYIFITRAINGRGQLIAIKKNKIIWTKNFSHGIVGAAKKIKENVIAFADIIGNIIAVDYNGYVIWNQSSQLSESIYNDFFEIFTYRNYTFVPYINGTLKVIDNNHGGTLKVIYFNNNSINNEYIFSFIPLNNYFLIVTNNGIYQYEFLSWELIKKFEINITSQCIIHNNQLFFHDNRKLYIFSIDSFKLEKKVHLLKEFVGKKNNFQQEQYRISHPVISNNHLFFSTSYGNIITFSIQNNKVNNFSLSKDFSSSYKPIILKDLEKSAILGLVSTSGVLHLLQVPQY